MVIPNATLTPGGYRVGVERKGAMMLWSYPMLR